MMEQLTTLKIKRFLRFAWHAVPEMLEFQLLTKGLLAAALFALRKLAGVLMRGGGYALITSSDLLRILRTWQGWALLLVFLFILFLYTAAEILAQIINSDNIMAGRRMRIPAVYVRGFAGLRAFVSAGGIPLIIFITFAVPLTGIGYTISLTSDFHLPNFITSVIYSSPLMILYAVGIGAAVLFSISNSFTFPGVILDNMTVRGAKRQSKNLVRAHFMQFVICVIPLFGIHFVLSPAVDFLFDFLTYRVLPGTGLTGRTLRLAVFFVGTAVDIFEIILNMLLTAVLILLVTVLYRLYTQNHITMMEEKQEPIRVGTRLPVAVMLALCAAGALFMEFFISDIQSSHETAVIAHRAGGILAAENSLEGLEEAISHGAYGSEIDVQRTSDGHYVINHDSTFSRLCGVSKKASEMTLEEIRQLTITDSSGGETMTAKIPTLEEMLDTCGDRCVLFIELKGETADYRMADDVAAMITERGLASSCVIISLKRGLVSYTEKSYPELNTGLLYYLGYGDVAEINADLLIMEEDRATREAIQQTHRCGKTAVVWTVNTKSSMERFFQSGADAVITDYVDMSLQVRDELDGRSDAEKIASKMKNFFT